MNVQRIILDGFITAVLFNMVAGLLAWKNNRIWLDAYPKKLREGAAPQTKSEAKLKFRIFNLAVAFIMVYMIFSMIEVYTGSGMVFWGLFFHSYIVIMIINFTDFVFLDLLFWCYLKPEWIYLEGVDRERYTARNWLLGMGIPEHFLLFPLLIGPLVSGIIAAITLVFI